MSTWRQRRRLRRLVEAVPDAETGGVRVGASLGVVGRPSRGEREAILEQLYRERGELLTLKRTGGISKANADFLDDINTEINRIEAQAHPSHETDDAWSKLDQIAAALVGLQAEAERLKR